MLKVINRFGINTLLLSHHLNKSFDIIFILWRFESMLDFTVVCLFKCTDLKNYTCMKSSAFVLRSLLNRMHVKTENHIVCKNKKCPRRTSPK